MFFSIDITVDTVGSCCTLVAEKLLDDEKFTIDHQVAVLLYGTILVDTVNTSPEAGKTTLRDTAVLSKLRQMLSDVDGNQLYNSIQQAKNDVSGLTTVEVLEKDLKMLTEGKLKVAMSSIPLDLKDFLSRPNLANDVEAFCQKNIADVLVILTMHVDNDLPHRELAVYAGNAVYRQKIVSVLEASSDPGLELVRFPSDSTPAFVAYTQGNVKASRKKILPIVKACMKDMSQDGSQTDQSNNSLLDFGDFDPFSVTNSNSDKNSSADTDVAALLSFDEKSQTADNVIGNSSQFGSSDFDLLSQPVPNVTNVMNDSSLGGLSNFDLLMDSTTTAGESANSVQSNDGQPSSQNIDLLSEIPSEMSSLPRSPVKINLQPSEDNTREVTSIEFDLLGDLTEADIVESPLHTPDIVVSGPQSGASSAPGSTHASRPGSTFPSVPDTPPNSFVTDSSLSNFTDLPSFNSSEMVKKIQEKKELLRGVSNESSDNEGNSVPFTPANSLMESSLDQYAKDHALPSFNSSDMIQRIQEKRLSLAGKQESTEEADQVEETSNLPFTPKNSFCDSQFDTFYQNNTLPSLSAHDMVQKVQNKRMSLEANDDLLGASSLLDNVPPLKPQNNVMENFDLLQTESALQSSENVGQSSDLLDIEPKEAQNVVAVEIAKEMKNENTSNIADLLDLDFTGGNDPDDSKGDKNDNTNLLDLTSGNQATTNQSTDNSDLNLNSLTSNQMLEAADLAAQEEAICSFTKEIIQDVLEKVSSSPPEDLVDAEKSLTDEGKSGLLLDVNNEHTAIQRTPSANGLTVETEYLSNMDPLQGNLDLVSRGGSDPEVVESTSFRKISGKEPMTVRKEILDLSTAETDVDKGEKDDHLKNSEKEVSKEDVNESNKIASNGNENAEINAEEKVSDCFENENNSMCDTNKNPKEILTSVTDDQQRDDSSRNDVNKENSEILSVKYVENLVNETIGEVIKSVAKEEQEGKGTSNAKSRNTKMDNDSEISSEELESFEGVHSDSESESKEIPQSDQDQQKSKLQVDVSLLEKEDSSLTEGSCDTSSTDGEKDGEECREKESISEPDRGQNDVEPVEASSEHSDISSGGISSPDQKLILEFETSLGHNSSSTSDVSSTTTEGSYKLIQSPEVVKEDVCEDEAKQNKEDDDNPEEIQTKEISAQNEELLSIMPSTTKRKVKLKSNRNFSISSESMSSDDEAKSDLSPLGEMTSELEAEGQREDVSSNVTAMTDKKVISFVSEDLIDDTDDDRLRSESEQSVQEELDSKTVQKEYFMTTAGRISVGCEEGERTLSEDITQRDEALTEVGRIITHVNGLITQVDASLAHSSDQIAQLDSSFPNSHEPVPKVDSTPACSQDPPAHPPSSLCMESQERLQGMDGRESGNLLLALTSLTYLQEKLQGVEFSEEWQDDGVPGMPPTENESDTTESDDSRSRHSSNSSTSSTERKAARPNSLGEGKQRRKIAANFSILSDDVDDDIFDPTGELEWENDTPVKSVEPLPEFTAQEEYRESRLWKGVEIGGKLFKIDLKVIEPYKRVLSHGGYYGDGLNAIIIFSGCYLPDRGRKDYQYVMDNLFMYVISTLETLVAEDYMIVYFHGATPRRQMPSFGWLKRCYQMIDRRLRKNLKSLMLVHPTLWLRTIVVMTRPFISSKFTSKLKFVRTLKDLGQILPMEYINVPDQVQQ
ncbi:hypothetical protein FSP39_020085 [Pinctada imbricata]|uniref:CRAL-TRIO domain-containing protein n=1 Tax=Pinctada imbricata TaxID=66713 RepID=A0AA88YB84_PINIB|nr:hypothetical protein FSP39_020085 [Pinctada imbricata]